MDRATDPTAIAMANTEQGALHPIVLLTPPSAEQLPAVLTLDRDVVLTAGAGTGKTRTLVARTLQILARRTPPRNIFAVTFTVKAAREMRNRLRGEIARYLAQEDLAEPERAYWDGVLVELEAARIGTIHSLCAEILRAHPAEADIDPAFGVLDEAVALQLRAEAIDEALGWAADDPGAVALFGLWGPEGLQKLLDALLADRLKAQRLFAGRGWERWRQVTVGLLQAAVAQPDLQEALEVLLDWEAQGAVANAMSRGDKLAPGVQTVLARWRECTHSLAAGDLVFALSCLAQMRDAVKGSSGQASNWPTDPKPCIKCLREAYDAHVEPLAANVDPALDEELAAAMPVLAELFGRALAIYTAAKAARHALDFDDLEQGVLDLLRNHAEARARWCGEAAAILVDEFQDTNERQRELVDLLNAGRGRLFIVGDAKQSIYRFRGAEVEVFRLARRELASSGLACDLARSHRTHRGLLATVNCLLAEIMGEEEIAGEPWHEPFAPLAAVHETCSLPFPAPFVELHLAAGTKGEGALDRAACALAHRLQMLVAGSERKLDYGDIAVLCRGSRSFGAYEDAFEAAGIPYETVAGRGFLDRPEIRDLLNALAALADPSDDLALYGLLRSPAIALPDTVLHRLRFAGGREGGGLWAALRADDAPACRHAAALIGSLAARAGRIAVADLLKQLVDATYYQAALLAADDARAARNVGKLLQDAQRSGIVGVGAFLEYVKGLRAAGSREGEARADSRGAVQIMTVHQAKGLEFPVVVLGDAGGMPGGGGDLILDRDLGVVPGLSREKCVPLVWKLAQAREELREAAETRRLLYVAATRAQHRLLISGCVKVKSSGELAAGGWLQAICGAGGVTHAPGNFDCAGPGSADLGCFPPVTWAAPAAICGTLYGESFAAPLVAGAAAAETETAAEAGAPHLLPAIAAPVAGHVEGEDAPQTPDRIWRVAPPADARWCPAWVIGKLVHAAIAAWRWPGEPQFDAWCRAAAHTCGLIAGPQVDDAVRRTGRLLHQLRRHPLYTELAAADERLHEVPFTAHDESPDGVALPGQIDLLFRRGETWTLVDFKTDRIRDERSRAVVLAARGYYEQVARYAAAVRHYLGITPHCLLCLLDDRGAVSVVRVGEATPGAVQAPAPPAEAGTPAGSADAYWHTAWEQAVVYAAPVCHSLLDACRRAGLPAPEVGIDITDARGRVMAMAELAWPDTRTAVFLGGQESAVLLAGQAGWQTLLVDGLQESAELGAALIGMLKARDTT